MFAGIGPSLISGGFSALGAARANNASKDFAAQQFDWYREHDAKKYRTAVKDMRLAGLNPILAAGGGVNAGSTPGASAAKMHNEGEAAVASANSALTAKRLEAELDLIKEQAGAVRAGANKTRSEQYGIDQVNKVKRNVGVISDAVSAPLTTAKSWFDKGWQKAKKDWSDFTNINTWKKAFNER